VDPNADVAQSSVFGSTFRGVVGGEENWSHYFSKCLPKEVFWGGYSSRSSWRYSNELSLVNGCLFEVVRLSGQFIFGLLLLFLGICLVFH
jgi:hypothetical protein